MPSSKKLLLKKAMASRTPVEAMHKRSQALAHAVLASRKHLEAAFMICASVCALVVQCLPLLWLTPHNRSWHRPALAWLYIAYAVLVHVQLGGLYSVIASFSTASQPADTPFGQGSAGPLSCSKWCCGEDCFELIQAFQYGLSQVSSILEPSSPSGPGDVWLVHSSENAEPMPTLNAGAQSHGLLPHGSWSADFAMHTDSDILPNDVDATAAPTDLVFGQSRAPLSYDRSSVERRAPSPPPPPPPTPVPQTNAHNHHDEGVSGGAGAVRAGGSDDSAPPPRRRWRRLVVNPPVECQRCGEVAERDVVCGMCRQHVCRRCRLRCALCAMLFCQGCLPDHVCVDAVGSNGTNHTGADPSGRDGVGDDNNDAGRSAGGSADPPSHVVRTSHGTWKRLPTAAPAASLEVQQLRVELPSCCCSACDISVSFATSFGTERHALVGLVASHTSG